MTSKPKLAAGEMELMGLLWEHGPVSISEAMNRLAGKSANDGPNAAESLG